MVTSDRVNGQMWAAMGIKVALAGIWITALGSLTKVCATSGGRGSSVTSKQSGASYCASAGLPTDGTCNPNFFTDLCEHSPCLKAGASAARLPLLCPLGKEQRGYVLRHGCDPSGSMLDVNRGVVISIERETTATLDMTSGECHVFKNRTTV
jgi:hypothetical protein